MTPRRISDNELGREAKRVLTRLADPGSYLCAQTRERFALCGCRSRRQKSRLHVDAAIVDAFAAREWLRPAGGDTLPPGALVISDVGVSHVRRLARSQTPFRAQHQVEATRHIEREGGVVAPFTVNLAETPLGWLRTRKGPNGAPLISAADYEAGERLREDFERARLAPRLTTDWELVPSRQRTRRGGRDPAFLEDGALAARQRLRRALDAVGPGLADVLIEICCHLSGLEAVERALGWPQRSAKVVLQIALARLALHYGLTGDAETKRPTRDVAGVSRGAASTGGS